MILFFNTNGYLSLVYAYDSYSIKIINYNGTVYQLTSKSNYVYKASNKSLIEFLSDFPEEAQFKHDETEKILSKLTMETYQKDFNYYTQRPLTPNEVYPSNYLLLLLHN